MPKITQKGYTEDGYLSGPEGYLGGEITHGTWSQINRQITTTHRAKTQVNRHIATVHKFHEQIKIQITKIHRAREQVSREINGSLHRAHSQVNEHISSLHRINNQIGRDITKTHRVKEEIRGMIHTIHSILEQIKRQTFNAHYIEEQSQRVINKVHRDHEQIRRVTGLTHHFHEQVGRHTSTLHHKKSEIRRGHVEFITAETYLEGPYLEGPYLAPGFDAHVRSQVNRDLGKRHPIHTQVQRVIHTNHRIHNQIQRRINAIHKIHEQIQRKLTHSYPAHSQVKRRIDMYHRIHTQVQRRINKIHRIHEQITRLAATLVHSQITQVLYNTTNLRILLDFPSRGSSGTNWTASSTMSGDFSVNNVNTDIVEQVWRSNTGDKAGVSLVCDTQVTQGVFVDTLALLNTNLTTTASILWEASNDAGFSSVGFTQVLPSTKTNVYYIAPTLPTSAFRYHRFSIDDSTNTATFLQVGTIVFGSSIIFQGEAFVDQVTRQTVHFADKIATEAFTNVSNDRAIKVAVGLQFKNLEFNKGNYTRIRDVFETARTSFKCLWVPTPQYTSRYAVFGKLTAIPAETHNDFGADQDYVDFSINVDESL